MHRAFRFPLKTTVALASSALLAQAAWASGYHFGTQSVGAQSTANASAAEAADPSTVFYNPAGLAQLPGMQFSANLNLVAPKVKYSNASAAYPGGVPAAVAGQSSGTVTKSLIGVPHLYGSWQISDSLTAGLGIYVPFASETEYDATSVLRYNVNQTKLTSIDVNPTLAIKLNDQHALGFGIIAQQTKAELRQYANWSAAMPGGRNGLADGVANVSGSDWGYGFNLGWLWDVNDNVRVGASYRSKIKHSLKGTATWDFAANAIPAARAGLTAGGIQRAGAGGYVPSEDASVDVTTPASLSLHGMWKMDPQWTLYGDLTWTQHSALDVLNIEFANAKRVANVVTGGMTQSSVTNLAPRWRDTFKLAAGASYQVSDPLQVRFGLAYDQSPVRDEFTRLTTMPDNDRIWLSGGLKYQLGKSSTLDLAYSYIHIKKASAVVNGWCGSSASRGPGAVNCVSSRTNGRADYKSHAHILGVAYTHRF